MSLAHPTRWRQRHYRGDGLLIWASGLGELGHEGIYRATDEEIDAILAQKWQPNGVTNEGEKWVLEAAFRDNPEAGKGGTFVDFELQLSTSASLSETSTYATRSELSDGSGYADINVARGSGGWTAAAGDTPASVTTPTSGTHQWTATGTWSTVQAAMICTNGLTTNVLIAYNNLSAARTLQNNDTLDVDFDLTAEAV